MIVAGDGNKAGKTTMSCRIIEGYAHIGITAIKITHHFHDVTPGLKSISEGEGYSVYEEHDREAQKDTSRMLSAGASRVFFAKVSDSSVADAFNQIMKQIPPETPIVCESPSLRYYAEPGMFIIMESETSYNKKDISKLLALPHIKVKLSELKGLKSLPFTFNNGEWRADK